MRGSACRAPQTTCRCPPRLISPAFDWQGLALDSSIISTTCMISNKCMWRQARRCERQDGTQRSRTIFQILAWPQSNWWCICLTRWMKRKIALLVMIARGCHRYRICSEVAFVALSQRFLWRTGDDGSKLETTSLPLRGLTSAYHTSSRGPIYLAWLFCRRYVWRELLGRFSAASMSLDALRWLTTGLRGIGSNQACVSQDTGTVVCSRRWR